MNKKKAGFTLIEMTIVLFIISLLILIVVPNVSGQRKHATDVHVYAMQTLVQGQIDSFASDENKGDVSMDALVKNGYLTQKQADQAQEEGIQIVDNKAVAKE